METNIEGNSLIIIKDHKENADSHPTLRLINPAKNKLGRTSKLILDKINEKISQKFELNQWENTEVLFGYFKQMENKNLYKFELLISYKFMSLKNVY